MHHNAPRRLKIQYGYLYWVKFVKLFFFSSFSVKTQPFYLSQRKSNFGENLTEGAGPLMVISFYTPLFGINLWC